MKTISRLAVVFFLFCICFVGVVCGGGGSEKAARDSSADDDDPFVTDDDDHDTPPGDPCTTSFYCTSGACGDLPCWEQNAQNGCEGACYIVSTPEGNNEGYCVDACEKDGDCPEGWFCLPECPDIEGYFEIRWCIQNEYDFMRECQ